MERRKFLLAAAGGTLAALAGLDERISQAEPGEIERGRKTRVSLVRTGSRKSGISSAVDLLGANSIKGEDVLLKPNFNTADPFPGSTHNDTLEHLIKKLGVMGAGTITIGERSGPPDTKDVLREKGIYGLAERLGVGLINFEELPSGQWVRVRPPESHWRDGFDVARPVLDAGCVVAAPCLKTHAYGGVFTISLKLSVGITHKDNMAELHSSLKDMRRMIAEINLAYSPSLIVLDAMEAFVDGGPMTGLRKRADVIAAGTDRVAVDAVGLAILKELGSNREIMERKIFAQEQIARAVELGLGAQSPEEIEIVTGDAESEAYAKKLREILKEG